MTISIVCIRSIFNGDWKRNENQRFWSYRRKEEKIRLKKIEIQDIYEIFHYSYAIDIIEKHQKDFIFLSSQSVTNQVSRVVCA